VNWGQPVKAWQAAMAGQNTAHPSAAGL